ncbi:SGNH/GDSL hydrolase family protein [Nocardioides panacisoli]|uniref:SGNH hydrolase-type esterase domain-containing protein n=1 Tax=Nocardioides panacisoli TaxID=627624 RepID=A0ABP7HSV4_9ACTN
MQTRGRIAAAAIVVALVATVIAVLSARAGAHNVCAGNRSQAQERGALVTGTGPEVLVIGDSYSVGLGVKPAESWPTYLPGRVRVDGFSGSGFSYAASGCPGVDYATRAETSVLESTKYVVVEGGLNDYDQPMSEVQDGFRRLMQVLGDREVLIVGPANAPSRVEEVPGIDEELARLSKEYGATYLSMLDLDLSYQDDDLHPDVNGHRLFGERVATAVENAWHLSDRVG